MKKRILVVSHERSGTHFLMNSISANFSRPFKPTNVINARAPKEKLSPEGVKNFLERHRVPSFDPGEIFKSHHDVKFYELSKDYLKEHYNVFYVYRDCKDVLTSMYHYFNAHRDSFPYSDNIYDFCLNLKIDKDEYSSQEYHNFTERWKTHVDGWLASDIPNHKISYEDLSFNFNDVIREIAQTLEEAVPSNPDRSEKIIRPKLGQCIHDVWSRKGIVGDWENSMDNELANKIDSLVCV